MERIHILFVQHKLVCGGAEQALFDLIGLLDKTRFEAKIFVQNPGGRVGAEIPGCRDHADL